MDSTPSSYDPNKLEDYEIFWRDRYYFFRNKGYILRPRYHPEWQPSWRLADKPNTLRRQLFEDNILQLKSDLLDAREDKKDGKTVFIKRVDLRTNPQEVEIASFLGSEESQKDERNHCIRVLDAFTDCWDPLYQYIVMPVLRPFNEPDFTTFGEVVEFVNQTLEGLVYMHEQNIAHRDCAAENILMDGSNLYNSGWHPMRPWLALDGRYNVFPSRRRSEAEIRYCFIDFGLSTRLGSEQHDRLVTGVLGRTKAPEQFSGLPYDPFKLDIYYLGVVYQTKIVNEFKGLEILGDLAHLMTERNPEDRLNANETQRLWKNLLLVPSIPQPRMRLRPARDEGSIERIMNDALDVVDMVRGSVGL